MKLSRNKMLLVSFMLFSLFFGAGNLIFPPFLGQNAGNHTLPAMLGFLATAVVLPVLGVVVVARFDGLDRLGQQVGKRFAIVFTLLIYLSIGPGLGIPRAALTADDIAKEAEFFSFGTNDLTQMTFGFSRDDAGKFLGAYYDKKIYENDPFAKLDQVGVGKLVEMAAKLGRATRPDLHLGICGEHGGDPSSVEFCHRVGLDYVSCSPFRVPIARLAAAQAAIREQRQ